MGGIAKYHPPTPLTLRNIKMVPKIEIPKYSELLNNQAGRNKRAA